MRETALAVIGKNHGVMRRDFPTESVQVRKQNFLLRHTLEVSPQHLLLPGDDSQLHGRFQLRVEVEERPDRRVMQERLEVLSGFIVSKHREERNTGSHGGDVTATFAAPPRRSSRRVMRTTGTGASGEMRFASPNQY